LSIFVANEPLFGDVACHVLGLFDADDLAERRGVNRGGRG